jgi:hypothetical protein
VIIGGGPTGRTVAALLPGAALVARPETTAWHVEPGTVWTWRGDAVTPIGFDTLVLAAPVPQLALALGCAMRGWQPMIDPAGRTSVAGVFAIGGLIGTATDRRRWRKRSVRGGSSLGSFAMRSAKASSARQVLRLQRAARSSAPAPVSRAKRSRPRG